VKPGLGLPPAFSPEILRQRYPDLADFDDATMAAHYEAYGRAEGRISSAGALRSDFIKLIDPDACLLEIGPYFSPVFVGPNVQYLDVFDATELRSKAVANGFNTDRIPDVIHFTKGLDECSGRDFDAVFSSHAIEHQPDLIRHLQAVSAALKPGGAYWVIIPDKRYCFDHPLPETRLVDVLDAYLEKRTRHTAKAVISHMVLTDHNDPLAHWQGRHGEAAPLNVERMRQSLKHFEDHDGAYIDCHAWHLTPDGFRAILRDLTDLGMNPFGSFQVHDTPYGTFEFTAVLSKPG